MLDPVMVYKLMCLLVTRQDRTETTFTPSQKDVVLIYQVEEDRRQGDTGKTSLQPMALILCADKVRYAATMPHPSTLGSLVRVTFHPLSVVSHTAHSEA